MKARDFIRLPIETRVELTDGIYRYRLHKTIAESGKPIYSIKEIQFGGYCCLFEGEEDVYDDSSDFKRKIMIGVTHAGGISFHSTDMYSQLRKLKIVPKSSYRKTFIDPITPDETEMQRDCSTIKEFV